MLTSCTRFIKINLIIKYIIFKNKGLILYTGLDLKKFKRTNYESKSNSKTFIQIGEFNEKKGKLITIKLLNSDLFKKTFWFHSKILIRNGR